MGSYLFHRELGHGLISLLSWIGFKANISPPQSIKVHGPHHFPHVSSITKWASQINFHTCTKWVFEKKNAQLQISQILLTNKNMRPTHISWRSKSQMGKIMCLKDTTTKAYLSIFLESPSFNGAKHSIWAKSNPTHKNHLRLYIPTQQWWINTAFTLWESRWWLNVQLIF